MFTKIVGNLYIGKSNIIINLNDKVVPKTCLVKDILRPTGFTGNMPDYGIKGNFNPVEGYFEVTLINPKHTLFITGIPKVEPLDFFRIQRVFFSSYYEDEKRGYLFQITDSYPKLIIKKKEDGTY